MANWLLPVKTKKYNVNDAFNKLGTIDWRQTKLAKNVKPGDIAYIYLSLPSQIIGWKCLVIKTDKHKITINDSIFHIPPLSKSNRGDSGKWMELKALYQYEESNLVSLTILKKNGMLFPPQGPKHATNELVTYLSSIENNFEEEDKLENIYPERGNDHPAKKKTTTTSYDRNPLVREKAFESAKGKCQLCGKNASFIDKNGRPFLEIHHIIWLSNGGEDSIHNTVALCPNCHRKMHLLNDPKDIAYLKKLVR